MSSLKTRSERAGRGGRGAGGESLCCCPSRCASSTASELSPVVLRARPRTDLPLSLTLSLQVCDPACLNSTPALYLLALLPCASSSRPRPERRRRPPLVDPRRAHLVDLFARSVDLALHVADEVLPAREARAARREEEAARGFGLVGGRGEDEARARRVRRGGCERGEGEAGEKCGRGGVRERSRRERGEEASATERRARGRESKRESRERAGRTSASTCSSMACAVSSSPCASTYARLTLLRRERVSAFARRGSSV